MHVKKDARCQMSDSNRDAMSKISQNVWEYFRCVINPKENLTNLHPELAYSDVPS